MGLDPTRGYGEDFAGKDEPFDSRRERSQVMAEHSCYKEN